LKLVELVAGTLILYPRYLDPVTEQPCSPEILLQRLSDGWLPKKSWLIRLRQIEGRIARLLGTVSR
jgi:capsular polysaccharide export protein